MLACRWVGCDPLAFRIEYVLTMPNMYGRGILFGKMVLELGDTCTVRNEAQDLQADLEFKTRGFFSGTYNAIAGRVKHGSTELGEVNGKWSALMEFKAAKVRAAYNVPLPLPLPLSLLSRRSCMLAFYVVDRREAHIVRRAEARQRRRAQVGRSRGRAGAIREPPAVARSHARHPRQGHGRRDGVQDGHREHAARAARVGRQARDALFRAAREPLGAAHPVRLFFSPRPTSWRTD